MPAVCTAVNARPSSPYFSVEIYIPPSSKWSDKLFFSSVSTAIIFKNNCCNQGFVLYRHACSMGMQSGFANRSMPRSRKDVWAGLSLCSLNASVAKSCSVLPPCSSAQAGSKREQLAGKQTSTREPGQALGSLT